MRLAILDHDTSHLVPLATPLEVRLGQLGVAVTCVLFQSVDTLLKFLREGSTFKLLLLDWTVAAVANIALVRRMRCDLALDLPIVIVTVNASEQEVACALHEGADDMVTPFRPVELTARVRRLLVPYPVTSRMSRTRWGPWTLDL